MKYGKSDKGYFVVVAKVGSKNGEGMEQEDVSSEMEQSDPLSKFVPEYRGASFTEAGFKLGTSGGKETWIPTGESVEKFSNEETSDKLAFQVVGNDKYDPVVLDISGKLVKNDKAKEMGAMSGKDLAQQLHQCLICEYKPDAEECCCALMSIVKPEKENNEEEYN